MIRTLLRPWWMRWIALPLAVLFAAHAGLTLTLKWEFERRLADLRVAGAPVDLADLRRPKIPDEDNAAVLWEDAHKWHKEHVHVPGVLLTDALPEDLWDEDDRAAVSEYLTAGDPYVDLLARAAAKRDMLQDLTWEAGPDLQVLAIPQMHDAMTYLEHRVRFAERAPDGLRQLAIMLDLAPKLERSILICVLVQWTVRDTAAKSLRTLARKPGFDAGEARALLDSRFAAHDTGLLRDAFRGERVQGLSIVRRWIGGESPIRIAKTLSGTPPDENEWALADTLSASWLARPLAYRDALRFMDLMERKLRLVDVPAREAFLAAEELGREYRDVPSPLYLFSRIFGDLAAKAMKNRLRHEANMRIARVGLALLELRQTTGTWPESLDAVVPLVGEEWVKDPYTDERLQYEPGVRIEAAVPIPYEDLRADDEIVWRLPPW